MLLHIWRCWGIFVTSSQSREEPKWYDAFLPAICYDPQHFSPYLIDVRSPVKWTCPTCGKKTTIFPNPLGLQGGYIL